MRRQFSCITIIAVAAYIAACGGGAPTSALSISGGGATGSATLEWAAPTQNSDGTALIDLAGYRIFQGTTQSTSALVLVATLSNPSVSVYVIEDLSPGTHYFAITALRDKNIESGFSNLVSITIN